MTDIRTFNEQAERRIVKAVKKIEGIRPANDMRPRWPALAYPLTFIGLAQADIEHNTIGNCKAAEGTDYDSNVSAYGDTLQVYNPGPKVWNGSRIAIEHWALAGAIETRYVIRHAWSATRIRGQAAATINPGLTGSINTVIPLNGYFNTATATVYLPTENVVITSGVPVWAELVFQTVTGTSRWEVYSADCVP